MTGNCHVRFLGGPGPERVPGLPEIMKIKKTTLLLLPLLVTSCATQPDPVDAVRDAANETIGRVGEAVIEKAEREINGPDQAYLDAVAAYRVESESTTVIRTNSASRIFMTDTRGGNRIRKKVLSDHDHDGKYEELFEAFFASNRPIVAISSGLKMGNGILFNASDGLSVGLEDKNRDGQFDQMLIMGENPTRLIEMFMFTNDAWQAISPEKYYEMNKGVEAVAPLMDATTDVIKGNKRDPNQ